MRRWKKVTLIILVLALGLAGCLVTARPMVHTHGAVYVGGHAHGHGGNPGRGHGEGHGRH
jgi:hypothetical protein